MGKENSPEKTEDITKEITLKIKSRDMGNFIGQMGDGTKEDGKMESSMEEVCIIIQMALSEMANG